MRGICLKAKIDGKKIDRAKKISKAIVENLPLSGEIGIIPSKSVSHRAIICSALAGDSKISNVAFSQDVLATISALKALGYDNVLDIETGCDCVVTSRPERTRVRDAVDCSESGSTLRFLLPLAMDGEETFFTGSPRLMQRSLSVYERLTSERAIAFEKGAGGIRVCGALSSGLFSIKGDVSSQFVSGLMFALPTLAGDSHIEMTTPVESRPYINITMDVLSKYGIACRWEGESTIYIPGGQTYSPANVSVEGDFSHAAFYFVAGLLGDGMFLKGIDPASVQGDKSIVSILTSAGADIRQVDGGYTVGPSKVRAFEADVSQTPDLLPILAVAACSASGVSRLYNAARLRDKESDRLSAICSELRVLGANIEEYADSIVVNGTGKLSGGACNSHNDHRIAMALCIASAICDSPVIIDDPMCTDKSAPFFWEEVASIGASVKFM